MTQDDNEKLLIERIASQEETAFEELVGIYKKRVINFIYRFVYSIEDAQDLAQDVFVKIWNAASSFKGRSKVSTWIYAISANLAINHKRKKRLVTTSLDSVTITEHGAITREVASPSNQQPDSILEEKTMKSDILRSIDKLAPNQKTALILSHYENRSYKEIAEIMKTSVSSIESLLFRAKQNLKKLLKNIK